MLTKDDIFCAFRNLRIRSRLHWLQWIGKALVPALLFCLSCGSAFGQRKQWHHTPSTVSIDFGSVPVGVQSFQTVQVTNTAKWSATISAAAVTGTGFTYTGPALPLTLSRGQSVNLTMAFIPSGAGTATGNLSVTSDQPVSPSVVSLTGNGVVQATLLANPGSLGFGNVLLGSSTTQAVSLSNAGNGSLSISQANLSGTGFTAVGLALPLTLAPGQSIAFTVNFSPATTGGVNGTISLISDASNSPMGISLSGAGVQPLISVVPSSVSFGNVAVGLTNTQTVTISNPGTANLNVTQSAGPGTGFSASGLALPLTIGAGKSTTFTVAFTPTAAGNLGSSIALVSNAPSSPIAVSLTGSGTTPLLQLSASPASVNFGSDPVGSTATQSVTLTNTGNSSVSVSQIAASGSGFSVSGTGLPVSLSPGQTTGFSAVFVPNITGSVMGTITVTSTAADSPLSIPLSGSGAQASHSVSLSWTGSSVAGYNIYRATQSSGPFTKLNSTQVIATSYTDAAVPSGQTLYYVTTAVDSNGVESAYSNEVSATIP